MGIRRVTCGSGNNTTEYREDISNGSTHEDREGFRLFLCVLCIGIALALPHWASAQDETQCLPHCWSKVSQDLNFNDGVLIQTIDAETECKDVCANNETCLGTYWGYNPALKITSCWLQMPIQVASESLTNATHWTLSNCSDDCLSYCWKPKLISVQTSDGVLQKGIDTENQCKVLCSNDQTCNGADWNGTEPSCWLLFHSKLVTKTVLDPIHHWEITRNLSISCENAATGDNATESGKPVAGENVSNTMSNASTIETNKLPVAGESSLANGSAPDARGGPNAGESNIGTGPVRPGGTANNTVVNSSPECPSYMTGISMLAVLMAACVLIIIGLIAYIVARYRGEQDKSESLLSNKNDGYRGYQSIQSTPETTESSEADAIYQTD